MTFFKWLAGIAAGVVVLALVLALVAAWLFDADAIKAEIEARVKSETGLVLSIDGDLSPFFFPGLGVKVGHTELHNPPGFADRNLAEFETLTLRVKLSPLLAGTVAPDLVAVEGLNVHLARSASGGNNFDRMLTAGNGDGEPPSALLALGRLELSEATLTYVDLASGERLRVTDLDFHVGPLSARRFAPLAARFRFSDPARNVEGHASVGAELSADPAQQTFRAQSLAAEVTFRGPDLPGGGFQIDASADARFDTSGRLLSLLDLELAGTAPGIIESPIGVRIPRATVDLIAGTASLERFALTIAGLDIGGDLAASELGKDPTLKGRVTVASFSPAELMARLGRPLPDTLNAELPDDARLESSVAGNLHGVTLEPLALTLGRVRADGRLHLGFSPGWPVTTAMRIEMPPITAGGPLQLTLSGSGRAAEQARYQADELELTLGPLTARGDIKLDASGDKLSYRASLTLPRFDARALLGYLGLPAPRTGDPMAFTRVEAVAAVAGGHTDLVLDPLTLKLDDTRISGSLSVTEMSSPGRAVDFELRADALDVGRYLPLDSDGSKDQVSAAAPLGILRPLNLNGRLSLAKLVVGDVVMDDVQLVARSRDGRLELQTGSVSSLSTSSARVATSGSLAPPAP